MKTSSGELFISVCVSVCVCLSAWTAKVNKHVNHVNTDDGDDATEGNLYT